MSNLIDRDEVLKLIETTISHPVQVRWIRAKINSLPLQQQWGNEKIKELIQKKLEETIRYWISTNESQYSRILWRKLALQEILKEIDNLPHNN